MTKIFGIFQLVHMGSISFSFCILLLALALATAQYTQPFYRDLSVTQPAMTGNDVIVAQALLSRSPYVKSPPTVTGAYDSPTKAAAAAFQAGNQLPATGVLDAASSNLLLQLHSADGYKDSGTIPAGFMYKVYIPVHSNRSIETNATLFNAAMQPLRTFTVRTHGQNDPNTGLPLNEFADSGATPTGLSMFDLNSPEDNATLYGPYPINRFVQGIAGNALFAIPNVRDGILMHTGEWANWSPPQPMPDSHGCVHGWPYDIQEVWYILVALGVQVRQNTFGKLPYPYKPQGVVSVELID